MVSIDEAVLARLKKNNNEFEVLVDLEKALLFKEGKSSLDDTLTTNDIFKDIKKGLHANEHEMQKTFNTTDKRKIAEIIIKQGEIQLTTEHRNKLREEKRKKIIHLISKNSIDPKTNLPHPPLRIENALNEKKVKIDEFKPAENQIQDIIKKISEILPIAYETREIAINIPAQYAGQSFHIFKQYGKIIRDNYKTDGSLSIVIQVPAGMQMELFDTLNKLTHGHVESQLLSKK